MDLDWFHTRLRELGENQETLARALKLPSSRIPDIKYGRRQIRLSEAAVMAKFFGVSLDELSKRLAA